MRKKIESMDQLQDEIRLSKERITQLESLLEDDINEIKKSFQPVNVVGNTIKNMVTSEKNNLVNASINIAVDTLIKNLIFRRSNAVLKLLVSFVAKNLTKNLYSKNAENIKDWLLSKLKRATNHSKEYYKEPNAAQWDV
jgi:hypothetical protein